MENKNKRKTTRKNSDKKYHDMVNDAPLTVSNYSISKHQILLDKVIESEFLRGFQ